MGSHDKKQFNLKPLIFVLGIVVHYHKSFTKDPLLSLSGVNDTKQIPGEAKKQLNNTYVCIFALGGLVSTLGSTIKVIMEQGRQFPSNIPA